MNNKRPVLSPVIHVVLLVAIFLFEITTGAAEDIDPNKWVPPPGPAKLAVGENPPCVVCWYVVHDPHGNSGFACLDGRLNYENPYGGGLFPTMKEIHKAFAKAGLAKPATTIIPYYGGTLYSGWKFRRLTDEELKILHSL